MIEMKHLSKKYDDLTAVNDISLTIEPGKVFGLLGTNGAGKSTLLRILAGILKADQGSVALDGADIYENPAVKQKIFYISDDAFFYPNTTAEEMIRFYALYYPAFNFGKMEDLLAKFRLDKKRKVNTYSKGMKKQLSLLLGICAGTNWLLCDESFDGLDPVMRQAIKSLLAGEMCERDFTPIIASHNLRELEDICDTVGLLHEGGILLSKDLEDLKCGLHKIQFAITTGVDEEFNEYLSGNLDLLQVERRGSLFTITAQGELSEILPVIQAKDPVFCEALPLTLEEIFISETEVYGYDVRTLIQ